jgi:uncharacterized protein
MMTNLQGADARTSASAETLGRPTVVLDGEAAPPLDPGPIALAAFASSTFLLSWVNAGLIDATAIQAVIASAWVLGGFIQFVVGVYALTRGRLFAATAFMSYGGFWISFAIYEVFNAAKVAPAEHGHATALFLAPWLIFTAILWAAAWRTNVALLVGLSILFVTITTLTLGQASGSESWIRIGGWLGLILSLEIFYLAAAELVNQVYEREVLPLGTLGQGRIAEI